MRLLILGVLMSKEPIHGYDLRRELETWRAEQWANIAYGSIYFALNKMAEEGLVAAVDTEKPGTRPARILYRITERGKQEFNRLLHDYWWEFKPTIDPFQVALTFMNKMPRDELLVAMRYRADLLQVTLKAFKGSPKWDIDGATPRHIAENMRLVQMHMQVELQWLEETIGKVERGELP